MEANPLLEPSNWLSAIVGALGAWAGFKRWSRSEKVEESRTEAVVSINESTRTLVDLLTKQVLELTNKLDEMQRKCDDAEKANRRCDELNRQMAFTIAQVKSRLEQVQREREPNGTEPPLLHR